MPGADEIYDEKRMREAVRVAGARLVDRLERVEQQRGNITLVFLTDDEAMLIQEAMVPLRDNPMARVLWDEMQAIATAEHRDV